MAACRANVKLGQDSPGWELTCLGAHCTGILFTDKRRGKRKLDWPRNPETLKLFVMPLQLFGKPVRVRKKVFSLRRDMLNLCTRD